MDKIIFKILFLLSIIALIGNYLDAFTTYFALQKDKAYETNTKMDYVIKHFGFIWFFIIKIIVNTYIFLFNKMCLIYLPIKFFNKYFKNENLRIWIIGYSIIILVAYAYSGYQFWSVSFNNLKFIM